MPPFKERIRVVFDTNVLVGYFLSRTKTSANARVWRMWRDERELQMILSEEVLEEYLELLERLGAKSEFVDKFGTRLRTRATVTLVTPGPRPPQEVLGGRDPDDNHVLAAARAGRAKFLITNDRDLLDIAPHHKKLFRFRILSPSEFLKWHAQK